MPDETPLADAIRRVALDAYARSIGAPDWNEVETYGLKFANDAMRQSITAAIAPLQAAITALLVQHRPDSDHCEQCTDSYEDRVTWPCRTVTDLLDPLSLPSDVLDAIRAQLTSTRVMPVEAISPHGFWADSDGSIWEEGPDGRLRLFEHRGVRPDFHCPWCPRGEINVLYGPLTRHVPSAPSRARAHEEAPRG